MGALLFDPTTVVEVAASQTAAVLTSGAGTYLKRLIVVPEALAAGAITLIQGTGVGALSHVVYFGGAVNPLLDVRPIFVDVDARAGDVGADSKGWRITTGASVHVIAIVQAA